MTKREKFNNLIEEMGLGDDVELLTADGFDDAILGIAEIFNKHVVVYDKLKCLKILMKSGMTYEEADEYFSFNVTGAYVGEATPAYLTKL